MRNVKCETGKWRSGDGNAEYILYSRVYMLCKVAQVFHARGGRPIVLFTSPFSGEESRKYICTHSSFWPILLLQYWLSFSVDRIFSISCCLYYILHPVHYNSLYQCLNSYTLMSYLHRAGVCSHWRMTANIYLWTCIIDALNDTTEEWLQTFTAFLYIYFCFSSFLLA